MLAVLDELLLALVASFVLTAVLRRALLRWKKVDRPREDRWHRAVVPRPGGPAIVATVLLAIVLFIPRPWSHELWALVVGGTFIFFVGLLDDLIDLSNPLKLTLLIVGAVIPLLYGVTFKALPAPLGTPLAMVWILAITNAMNWLDNMDGLAAGVSVIAGWTLMLLSAGFADAAGTAAALVVGASAGFLYFNFSPARIFMGDSGSGFLGFALAILAVWGTGRHVTNVVLALLIPILVLSIPIFDSAIVTLARTFGGRRLFQGGTDHPSHRLVVLGLPERKAVLALYGFSLIAAAAALVTARMGVWTGLVLAGGLLCGFVVLGYVVTRVRVYQDSAGPGDPRRVVLWQLMYKRRLLEMLLDVVLICVAYVGSYLLRYEGILPSIVVQRLGIALPLLVAIKVSALSLVGVYRGDLRYVGLTDLLTLARGTAVGSMLVVAAFFLWTRLVGFSRAAFVIDWILTFGLLSGIRVSVRLLQEYIASQRRHGRRVLIAGAGQGGIMLLQELRNNPSLPYWPVGFVDDDPVKGDAVIRGLPVLGMCRDIPALVRQHSIEEVLVAAPSMSSEKIVRIELLCSEAGARCRLMRPLLEPTID